MKIRLVWAMVFAVLLTNSFAQNVDQWLGQDPSNIINTAVPFLLISPDARSGAMGDAGVASSPDVFSMHWNPAKYAFIEEDMLFGISYTPWLKSLVPDINLALLNFSYKLDNQQAIAASLRYFSLGNISFTNEQGGTIGTFRPNEFSLDAAYSRKLSDNLSASVAARFIYSDLFQGQNINSIDTRAGISVAADVSVYWRKQILFSNMDAVLAFGANISNLGSKIAYSSSQEKDFIPTNLRFGPSLYLELNEFNSLTFLFDINKLLVPTPPIYERTDDGQLVTGPDGNYVILKGKDPNVSVARALYQSFFDAPDGFSEELKEFTLGFGLEYWYDKQFALRAGYFNEAEMKGNRKFITLGAGLKYNVFGLNFAYLIPTEQKHPLEHTLRFSLLFDFAQ